MTFRVYNADKNNKFTCLSNVYSTNGTKKIAISNNVKRLNVLSTLTQQQINPLSLKRIRLGENVQILDDNCFRGCENLSDVQHSDNIIDIGNYAFLNCKNLKYISIFDENNTQKLDNIGISAFSNTGLTNINISLRGSSTDTQIQSYAFAHCKSLKDVTWKTSDYTSHYMFEGCTNLTGVNFCDRHSFVGEHVFKDCTALRNVVIPANCYGINDYTFEGCTSLTSVTVKEPSLMKYTDSIGNYIFKDTKLTSFTFPSSISSFSMISKNALNGANYLTSITFSGINSSEVFKGQEEQQISEFVYNKWLYYDKAKYSYSEYCKNFSYIIETAKQKHIPLILIKNGSNCGYCTKLVPYVDNEEVINWMKSLNKNILFGSVWDGKTLDGAFKKLRKDLGNTDGGWPSIIFYWLKEDGSKVSKAFAGRDGNATNFFSMLKKFIEIDCAEYKESGSSGSITIISEGILNTNCFGLNHNCMIHTSDGKQVEYKDDGTGGHTINYESTTQVDRITTDDFRYGQWYYQAKDLREYADNNEIPVFLEFSSSRMCIPCADFHANIFNSKEFQTYMKNRKILLCNVDSPENFKYDMTYYITHKWASPDDPEFENKLPVMMMYWHKKYGSIIPSDTQQTTQPSTRRKYGYYMGHENPSLSDEWNVSKITAWVEEFCNTYTPQSRFNLPTIESHMENIPNKYKRCDNQFNDTYGRYFPVYKQYSTNMNTYTLDISGTIYTLNETMIGQTENMPPNGTYQYFTTLSTDENYQLTCDMNGILFQVGPRPVNKYTFDEECNPSLNITEEQFKIEHSITDEMIQSTSEKYYDTIYEMDEETNKYKYQSKIIEGETLNVPILLADNDCKTDVNKYQYNYLKIYNMQNFSHEGNPVESIKLYMNRIAYTEDEGETIKYKPSGYIVEYMYFSKNVSDGVNGLRWITAFTNETED